MADMRANLTIENMTPRERLGDRHIMLYPVDAYALDRESLTHGAHFPDEHHH
jgi:hypothetical protein